MQREHPEWLDLDAWATWRAKCALDLCDLEVQGALKEFMLFQFRRLLNRLATTINAPSAVRDLTMREAWHLFETHVTVRQTREGKRYKDWLFARTAQDPVGASRIVVAGAALLSRDAVRDWLRREFSPLAMLSMNQPLNENEALRLEDCLPGGLDPSNEAARREMEEAARGHAAEWFAAMGRRERLILLARFVGLALFHPTVEHAVGCRKSRACDLLKKTICSMLAALKREYPEDDEGSLRHLMAMMLSEMQVLVRRWAAAEPAGVELIRAAEQA